MGSDERAFWRLETVAPWGGDGTEPDPSPWLMAIVDNSFDAILSKTLDGIITSWNEAAVRLFGYSSAEAIGQTVMLIVPEDHRDEEADIISRLRRGERIAPFETVRRTRAGDCIDIELTVSPVRSASGRIVGASTIARDISERRRQAAAQELVLREMDHRIKNLLAVVQSLISVGRRRAASVADFADDLGGRVQALAAANRLILGVQSEATTLDAVLAAVLAPYHDAGAITVGAADIPVGAHALTSLALVLHELATNAVKYGGLSCPAGAVAIELEAGDDEVLLHWRETGGQAPAADRTGFGSTLLEASLRGLGGMLAHHWHDGQFEIRLSLPRPALAR